MNVFITFREYKRVLEQKNKEVASGKHAPKNYAESGNLSEEERNAWKETFVDPSLPKSSLMKNMFEAGRCLLQLIVVLSGILLLFLFLYLLK